MTSPTTRFTLAGVLLAWFLIFPSLGILQKYAGTRGALVYAASAAALLMLLAWHGPAVVARLRALNRRTAPWALVVVCLGVAALFSVLYPLSNSGVTSWLSPSGIIGGGSDRDEALNLGVRALLGGRYPDYERTQLDNLISQMPGSLVMAVPFVLLGNAAWQNLLWFGVLAGVSRRVLGDARAAAAYLLLVLAVSPVVLQDVVTGGDLATNAIMVLAALVWMLTIPTTAPAWKRGASAVLAGLAFSTRANFLLLLPLLVSLLGRRAGARATAMSLSLVLGTLVAATLPFYVYDPPSFAPLSVQNKFSQFQTAIPASQIIFPAISLIGGVALAFVAGRHPVWLWLIESGLVLTAPAAALVVLATARTRGLNLAYASYALPGLFFGVLGVVAWYWQGHPPADRWSAEPGENLRA